MEYQAPTYFAKLTFLCSLFPQVVISCLSSSLCQNARLSSAYCQIVNSTLLNHQLDIVNATLPICQVDLFFRLPKCYLDHPKIILKIVCPMAKIHSLATQTRFLWILLSTYPMYLPTNPSRLLIYLLTYLGIHLPIHVLSIYVPTHIPSTYLPSHLIS